MYYDRYSRNSRWNEEGGMKVQGSPGLSFFEKRSAKGEKKKGFFSKKKPYRRGVLVVFVMLEERKGCDINATKVINDCWKKEKDAIINATKCWVRAIPGSLQLCAQQHHQRSPQSFALVTHPHSKPFFWNSNTVMKRS